MGWRDRLSAPCDMPGHPKRWSESRIRTDLAQALVRIRSSGIVETSPGRDAQKACSA